MESQEKQPGRWLGVAGLLIPAVLAASSLVWFVVNREVQSSVQFLRERIDGIDGANQARISAIEARLDRVRNDMNDSISRRDSAEAQRDLLERLIKAVQALAENQTR